ncbi:hypothetical protein GGX14DRAFT_395311 [Mycena pura]|uniref:Uncharacterized protein n=1 Tax=Mycena pura TaxID=153505 RepID=A0AAD6VD48_9AGAR|nr:hypothetical protein GGX14DRAFT_395311 [Mycena pura]
MDFKLHMETKQIHCDILSLSTFVFVGTTNALPYLAFGGHANTLKDSRAVITCKEESVVACPVRMGNAGRNHFMQREGRTRAAHKNQPSHAELGFDAASRKRHWTRGSCACERTPPHAPVGVLHIAVVLPSVGTEWANLGHTRKDAVRAQPRARAHASPDPRGGTAERQGGGAALSGLRNGQIWALRTTRQCGRRRARQRTPPQAPVGMLDVGVVPPCTHELTPPYAPLCIGVVPLCIGTAPPPRRDPQWGDLCHTCNGEGYAHQHPQTRPAEHSRSQSGEVVYRGGATDEPLYGVHGAKMVHTNVSLKKWRGSELGCLREFLSLSDEG